MSVCVRERECVCVCVHVSAFVCRVRGLMKILIILKKIQTKSDIYFSPLKPPSDVWVAPGHRECMEVCRHFIQQARSTGCQVEEIVFPY